MPMFEEKVDATGKKGVAYIQVNKADTGPIYEVFRTTVNKDVGERLTKFCQVFRKPENYKKLEALFAECAGRKTQ